MLKLHIRCLIALVLAGVLAAALAAQELRGTLAGQVTDSSGASIPGAQVTIAGASAPARSVVTKIDGSFLVPDLPPGTYSVRITFPGFAPYSNTGLEISAGRRQQLSIRMKLAVGKQEVTVTGSPGAAVSTEPDNNAGALVLRGTDLDSLPDDPDDLAADLQALAGPSAGPNGGQIFIDGFTGGSRLPPKESIREIRINQNPFSAEYDRLGFGRIEILTKPGTDHFRGTAFFNFSDDALNSRNPYASNKPSFQSRMFGGNVSGPINRRASFFLDLEKRDIDDNAIVNALTLDPSLRIVPFSQAIVTPNRRTTISPRIDYQINSKNTLVGRYSYSRIGQDAAGIGQFSLPSRAYGTSNNEQTLQLTETAVLGPTAINETRVQFLRSHLNENGDNSIPTIDVLQAFTGGGSQIGHSYDIENRWEVQNYTTLSLHGHTVRFGVRARTSSITDVSPQNFGGTFVFTSLQRYRDTLLLQEQGYTPEQIRAMGAGATQFSIAGGNPLAGVSQADVGAFIQDDWRMRSNLTLSLGLRYETQTNIHDWADFAPRIGFAWAPGGSRRGQSKTVVRGGFGMFYDRFDDTLTLQAIRFNGINQQQYIVDNPDFYPAIPPLSALAASAAPQTIRQVDSNLRAPYILQTAIGIERQLPFNTTVATTFTNSRGLHLLRSRNINAPLPGGALPYGDIGNIYQYESSGVLNQNQWITNVNSRVNRRIALFAFYVLNHANSNTDGVTTFPANQYNESTEYGRSSLDIRHRFVLGGSFSGPFATRLSPFLIAHSGAPFNITTGRDANGDTLFLDRPAFATDLTRPGVVVTPFGAFDPNPLPAEVIIPRNYGNGPAYFTLNLRLSKTFGFGANGGGARADDGFHGGGGGRGGRGPGAMRMGGRGGGFHSIFGDSTTERRFNLTLAITARNVLNNVNPGIPIGNLNSPYFGTSNSLAGGFGPMASANNRRVDLQVRFSF